MLHAWRLEITLPGEPRPRFFEAPVPDDFRQALARAGLTLPDALGVARRG
jgi:hypothetical protein